MVGSPVYKLKHIYTFEYTHVNIPMYLTLN